MYTLTEEEFEGFLDKSFNQGSVGLYKGLEAVIKQMETDGSLEDVEKQYKEKTDQMFLAGVSFVMESMKEFIEKATGENINNNKGK